MRRLNVTQEDVVCPTITFINKGKVKSKDVRVVKENGVPVKLTNLSAKTFYPHPPTWGSPRCIICQVSNKIIVFY
jgi:hypothetical protein